VFAEILALERSGSRFARDISPFWSFGESRVFGGYAAALGVAAIARVLRMPLMLSCHVMFASATRPGPVEIIVEPLKSGRAGAAARALVQQGGEITVSVEAWFTAESLPPDSRTSACPVGPEPQSCPQIAFRAAGIPFMDFLEERAIDYPVSTAQFFAGAPFIDLWARSRWPMGESDVPLHQVFDVMMIDAHMLEPTRRARVTPEIDTVSLDLSVLWCDELAPGNWRRVRVESSPPSSGFALTTAAVFDERGAIAARATQLGRIRHPRPAGPGASTSVAGEGR
jgi:acyl-CoA thioesterase